MVKVLALYYSRTGNTAKLAESIVGGALIVNGVSAEAKRVDYATVYDLLDCDAVAFGSPNYFSYIAGLMKDYFDRALSVREKVTGKPAAAFTAGGGSSDSALAVLEKMIEWFKLEKVAVGHVAAGNLSKDDLEACKKIGITLAKAALKRAEEPRE